MEFLAGSHTHPYPTEDTYEADNLLTRGQVIDWSPEAAPDPALVVRPRPFRACCPLTASGSGSGSGCDCADGWLIVCRR